MGHKICLFGEIGISIPNVIVFVFTNIGAVWQYSVS